MVLCLWVYWEQVSRPGIAVTHSSITRSSPVEWQWLCQDLVWFRTGRQHGPNLHFSWFRVTPASCSWWRTASSLWSCYSSVTPCTSTSSIMQMTPWIPTQDLTHALLDGADVMPKGSLLKWNLPNGVMKVVRRPESGSIGICQNLELASSWENTWALTSLVSIWLTAGSGCHSLCTLSFSLVRLTHILTLPLGSGTTTIPAHHSAGS